MERAAFIAVFVALGKFCESQVGTWPAVGIALAMVFLPVGLYAVMRRRQPRNEVRLGRRLA